MAESFTDTIAEISEDDVAQATAWLATRFVNTQGKLRILWFDLPVDTFSTLGECVPPLSNIEQNRMGIRTLLTVVNKGISDELSYCRTAELLY